MNLREQIIHIFIYKIIKLILINILTLNLLHDIINISNELGVDEQISLKWEELIIYLNKFQILDKVKTNIINT